MSQPTSDRIHGEQRFELRGRVPLRLWAVLAGVDVVGLILIVLYAGWPVLALLVVGLALVVVGVVAAVVLMVVLGRLRQTIRFSDVGIHLPDPRPADIAWWEVKAVRTDGRVLRIELRDQTQMVVNGALFRHGFPEFRDALLARLRARSSS